MFQWFYKKIAKHVEACPNLVAEALSNKLSQLDTAEITESLSKNPYFSAEVGQAIVSNLDYSQLTATISTSDVADNLDLNQLSEVIDYNQIVNTVDYAAIASHINVEDLVKQVDLNYVSGIVADLVSLDNLAERIDYRKLAMALLEISKGN